MWEPFCSVPIIEAGIFPLRIMVNDPGGADDMALNRWSIRASTSGGPAPRVYGLGTMSIYANVDGSTGPTVFHLAEVREIHAGKNLIIEMFDLPDDYVCAGADCWWKVVYNYPGITRDSTTWSARIEGRPVHLTE